MTETPTLADRKIKMRYTAEKIAEAKARRRAEAKRHPKPKAKPKIVTVDNSPKYIELFLERQNLLAEILEMQKRADSIKDQMKAKMLRDNIGEILLDGLPAVTLTDAVYRNTDLDRFKDEEPEIYADYVTETPGKKIDFKKRDYSAYLRKKRTTTRKR